MLHVTLKKPELKSSLTRSYVEFPRNESPNITNSSYYSACMNTDQEMSLYYQGLLMISPFPLKFQRVDNLRLLILPEVP